jgi:hypothetical protein
MEQYLFGEEKILQSRLNQRRAALSVYVQKIFSMNDVPFIAKHTTMVDDDKAVLRNH